MRGGFKWYGPEYYISRRGIATLIIALLVSVGVPRWLARLIEKNRLSRISPYVEMPVLWFMLLLSISMVVNGNYSPFIYFRF